MHNKIRAAGERKSFSVQQFFKNAAEVWASSPHLRSKLFCNKFSLLQLHSLKLSNSNKVKQCESKLQIRTRQRGNCSTLAGKSRGGTPFCRTLKIVLPKSYFCIVLCKILFLEIPPESGSARLGHIPSLPWDSQLPLKPYPIFTTSRF